MSEEIASADSLLRENAELRARILEWEDCYDRLRGAFELHMDILECKQALSDYAGGFYDVLIGSIAEERDQLRAALECLLDNPTDAAEIRARAALANTKARTE